MDGGNDCSPWSWPLKHLELLQLLVSTIAGPRSGWQMAAGCVCAGDTLWVGRTLLGPKFAELWPQGRLLAHGAGTLHRIQDISGCKLPPWQTTSKSDVTELSSLFQSSQCERRQTVRCGKVALHPEACWVSSLPPRCSCVPQGEVLVGKPSCSLASHPVSGLLTGDESRTHDSFLRSTHWSRVYHLCTHTVGKTYILHPSTSEHLFQTEHPCAQPTFRSWIYDWGRREEGCWGWSPKMTVIESSIHLRNMSSTMWVIIF